jgi:transcriptional repressor NrdR
MAPLMVVKRDGRREPFDRQKLVAGLRRAVIKRPVSAEALERLVEQIERDLVDVGDREVEAAAIGDRVLVGLRELDPVAYVRFASVYRKFENLDQFIDELKRMRPPKGERRE